MMNINHTYLANLQQSSMIDECTINTYSETYDSYRDLTKTWTSGSYSASSICGVRLNGGSESYKDEVLNQADEITIRLPLTATITTSDTITLTKRNNTAISLTYQVLSIEIGTGNLLVRCKKLKV